jgi:hypothetical protein
VRRFQFAAGDRRVFGFALKRANAGSGCEIDVSGLDMSYLIVGKSIVNQGLLASVCCAREGWIPSIASKGLMKRYFPAIQWFPPIASPSRAAAFTYQLLRVRSLKLTAD